MLYKIVFAFWVAFTILGFLATSYGLLRSSFADLSQKIGFGEGRFGEGPYGGGLTRTEEFFVNVGIKARLLPVDRTLTATDKNEMRRWLSPGSPSLGCQSFWISG